MDIIASNKKLLQSTFSVLNTYIYIYMKNNKCLPSAFLQAVGNKIFKDFLVTSHIKFDCCLVVQSTQTLQFKKKPKILI